MLVDLYFFLSWGGLFKRESFPVVTIIIIIIIIIII